MPRPNYGLMTGMADTFKDFLIAQKTNQEADRANRLQKMQMVKDGIQEDEQGNFSLTPEAQAKKSADLQRVQSESDYLTNGRGLLDSKGLVRDPLTHNLVEDPNSPFTRERKVADAYKAAETKKALAEASKTTNAVENPKDPKITDNQNNAAGFAIRMEDAESDLKDLISTGKYDPTKTENVLKNKATGGLLESFKPEGAKLFNQLRDNFINAQLRRESGAAISQSEYSNADRQYFPVAGDTPAVLAQKERNRAVASAAMKSGAAGAYGLLKSSVPARISSASIGPGEGQASGGYPRQVRNKKTGQIATVQSAKEAEEAKTEGFE